MNLYRKTVLIAVSTLLPFSAVNANQLDAASSLQVQLDNNLLSATVKDQPVAQVIAALNRLVPGGCAIGGYVFDTPEATVSVSFQFLPLAPGLRRLLKGHDYLLTCDTDQAHGIRLTLLGHGNESKPLPAPAPADNPEPADPTTSLESLRELFDRDDIETLTAELETVIVDPDRRVREEALRLLSMLDDPVSAKLLDEMALTDTDPELRAQVLEVIVNQRETAAADLLLLATADQEPWVSDRARTLLARVEPAVGHHDEAMAEPHYGNEFEQ